MKNIGELVTKLADLYTGLEGKSVEPKVAKEMNNAAGKIINANRTQLEYFSLRKEKPNIPFLAK